MHPNNRYSPQQLYQQQLHEQQQLQRQQLQHPGWYPQQQGGQGFPQMAPMQQHQQPVQRQISIEDAIQIARDQVPGQVVKAELERKSGQLIYEVDVVTAENVKYEVKINADTGAVIEVELD